MTPNREQQAAIDSDAETTVVAAGPGSGKSWTLVQTVRARVADGVNPKRIVVLTFTNAGAHVYVARLKPLVLGFAGNVHGYCIRLLQAFGAELGYRAGSISVVTKETQVAMLVATAIKLFGKKKGGKPKLSMEEITGNVTEQSQLIWRDYRHDLKTSNMIDFDKILEDGVRLLQMRSVIDQLNVDLLLTDETQDSGKIDWMIFNSVPAKKRFIVGDPDQSIYVFRGGEPSIFVHLAQRDDVKLVTMSHNYRSDMAICEAASSLIRHNRERIFKPVIAVSNELGSVEVVEVPHGGAEIFKAYQLIRESGYAFGECAILCRLNRTAKDFQEKLRGFGVSVKRTGGMKLPADWSFALSAIGLLIDPDNNHHAEQVLRASDTEEAVIESMKQKARIAHLALSDMMGKGVRGWNITPLPLDVLLLLGVGDESMELIRKRVAVLPNPNPTLSDLLADLWNNDKWNVEDEGDGITVCTIHAAKGKEWDFVLVPACEEGILPKLPKLKPLTGAGAHGGDTVDFLAQENVRIEGSIEEERRLFFVAITRPRHRLVLTHAKERTEFFKTTTRLPSRFLQEIK